VSGRTLVDPRGRAKAYRPLGPAARAAALAEFVAAYGRSEYFEAHEILEPAWMGASDPLERELYSGLIKLAAAFVHADRANPGGVAKNLRGARERLAGVADAGRPPGGLDLPALVAAIEGAIAAMDGGALAVDPIPLPRAAR